jgi:hypothetical protein
MVINKIVYDPLNLAAIVFYKLLTIFKACYQLQISESNTDS